MKTAIVTGATSFLGVATTKLLLQKGIDVLAVVRPKSANLDKLPKSKNLYIIEKDLFQLATLPSLNLPHFDVFYHLAWDGVRLPARDNSVLQERNYEAASTAIIAAAKLGCSAFIGAGSQAEYGFTDLRIDENCSTNPTTPYGKAKLKVCDFGLDYSKNHGMRFVWPRVFSLYGDGDAASTLIMSCLNKMIENDTIQLSSCTQQWDYLHVSDAAEAFYLLGMSPNSNGIYNVASGESRPLREYVEEMLHISDSHSLLRFEGAQGRGEKLIGFRPDVSRLKSELNWAPKIKFNDGIIDLMNQIKMKRGNYEKN